MTTGGAARHICFREGAALHNRCTERAEVVGCRRHEVRAVLLARQRPSLSRKARPSLGGDDRESGGTADRLNPGDLPDALDNRFEYAIPGGIVRVRGSSGY